MTSQATRATRQHERSLRSVLKKKSRMKRSFGPSVSCAYKKIKLEADNPHEASSDTESILSVQCQSTDFAQDTSDTSTSQSDEEDEGRVLRRKFVLSTSEESEIQEIADFGAAVMKAVVENIDIGLADTSEECSTSPTSNSDIDPGLPRSDYIDFEKCQMCMTNNKDSSYPYCSKCYKMKKSFFPPRPKIKRRKSSLLRNKMLSGESSSEVNPGTSSEVMQSSQDSGMGSSQGLTETESSVGKSPPRRDPVSDNRDNLCEICVEKKRCGLFLHGNSTHLYGCYQCAKTSWFTTGGCPLCRRKVRQVIRLLN